MSLEADLLLDRRRLKRRLTFWRVLAVVGLATAVLAVVLPGATQSVGAHVARVNVRGVIVEDRRFNEAVAALAGDRSVAAVIIAIDSPGGSVAGGESLRAALLRVAAAKPVVAVMGGTAASAGYMVALPAARIFAREATLTGSIGVILQTGDVAGLIGRLGVSAEAITSGPLKDQPSFTRGLTPDGRAYLQGLVADMFDQFVAMVALGRNLPAERVRDLADGRAYTGRQALAVGLVDQIGGETEARAWLQAERKVSEQLPVRDVRRPGNLFERTTGDALSGLVESAIEAVTGLRVLPPGAWAIWQAGTE